MIMKCIAPVCFISLLGAFSVPAFSQYNVLPVGDGLWVESFWVGPGYPYMGWAHVVPGQPDTIINGLEYRSVDLGGNGYVRDDSLGHVFWLDPNGGQEAILYDFDVAIGDTLPYSGQFPFPDPLRVVQVDSILVNGTMRKQVEVELLPSGWGTCYWIQGIGSVDGLLNLCQGPSVSGTSWLTCMSEDGIAQYGGNVGQPYN